MCIGWTLACQMGRYTYAILTCQTVGSCMVRNQSRKFPARERMYERDSGSVRHACRGLGYPREADGGVSCGSRRIVLFGECVVEHT